jgi:thiol:disulfide interchange protein
LNGEITVKVSAPEGAKFRITKVYYPKPKLARYPAFGDDPVNAYEGIVRIPIEVLLPGAARGRANVSVRLRYQLCANSEGRCYPPKTELLSTTVSIVPRSKELSAAR